MITNILYCIDYPSKAEGLDVCNRVEGWLLCSQRILSINIQDALDRFELNYGTPRADVALHFKNFPDNSLCGFTINASDEPIYFRDKLNLQLHIEAQDGAVKSIYIALDLLLSGIQPIEIDDDESIVNEAFKKTEETFISTLKQHPWLTIRMDITNKCNLRCIMCHYKEAEIYSQPVKAITADQLKHQLQDIAPFVKHIMLSCGFEPLMSKHFHDIVSMLHTNYPHMEIAFCTNAMLLNSKARKTIIENNVTHVLLSLDGVTKNTVEKIRVGANFEKIISNIMALRDLKQKDKRDFPKMFMDFVLMNSNIHEAPAFVELCVRLGIDIIDFRHLVGNIYFSEHEEMLQHNKEKYNYFRQKIIEASRKFNIDVRLPEPFETTAEYSPEALPVVDLSEFNVLQADVQTEDVTNSPKIQHQSGQEIDFEFLSGATCMRPFSEIMIVDQEKILPCSYYSTPMGHLDEGNTLYSIFFNENFKNIRQRKMHGRFDHNCINCPVKMNLLPTEIVK